MGQVWIVKAGRDDEYEAQAMTDGLVAVGWRRVADLSGQRTLAAINTLVDRAYPEYSERSRREFGGQLYAIRSGVKAGDHVLLLRSRTPEVAIGVVTGEYAYRPDLAGSHVRPVDWLAREVRRSEIGSDLLTAPALSTIFRVGRTGADERIAALVSPRTAPTPPVASLAEPPVARRTALENFRSNIRYALSLAEAGYHLESLRVGAFEVADIYRAAWVQAVAALDHWVHQEIRERMGELAALPAGKRPSRFRELQLPVALVDQIAAGPMTLGQALEQNFQAAYGHKTFQDPAKIREGLALVADVNDLWGRTAEVLTERSGDDVSISRADVQKRLSEIVKRRNKIAHEYDEDPEAPPAKRAIDTAATTSAISFIQELAEAMAVVLDA